jgi:hypothetical protein
MEPIDLLNAGLPQPSMHKNHNFSKMGCYNKTGYAFAVPPEALWAV